MCGRRSSLFGAVIVTAALLLSPVAGQARVHTRAVSHPALRDHCIHEGPITICFVT
jgi:hypothetical protein